MTLNYRNLHLGDVRVAFSVYRFLTIQIILDNGQFVNSSRWLAWAVVPIHSCCTISVMQVRIMSISDLKKKQKTPAQEVEQSRGQSLGTQHRLQLCATWCLLLGIPKLHLWKFSNRVLAQFSGLIFTGPPSSQLGNS